MAGLKSILCSVAFLFGITYTTCADRNSVYLISKRVYKSSKAEFLIPLVCCTVKDSFLIPVLQQIFCFSIIFLAFVLACGGLLVALSGALYGNWWPLFVVGTFVTAPLSNLIFSKCSNGDGYISDESNNAFADFGRFLTALIIVTGFGLPIVLAHVEVITTPAMIMSIVGGGLIYVTIETYIQTFSSDQGDGL